MRTHTITSFQSSRWRHILLASLLTLLAPALWAQNYPEKPIKLVVSFTAGGTTDILAREVANQLTQRWGVSVVVENKPGAAGNLGTEIVGRAAPDGYTLLANSFGPIAINPTLFKNLAVNPHTELQPVAMLAEVPTVLVVPTSLGIQTLADLLKYAKAHPDEMSYGSTGIGTAAHMTGFLFSQRTNMNALHVPYKGGGQQITDALAGHVEVLSVNAGPAVMAHVRQGRLRALAVGAPARLDSLPQVPTLEQAGFANANLSSVFGLFAPARTPAQVVARLNLEVNRVLQQAEFRRRLLQADILPTGGSSVTFVQHLAQESQHNARVIQAARIQAD